MPHMTQSMDNTDSNTANHTKNDNPMNATNMSNSAHHPTAQSITNQMPIDAANASAMHDNTDNTAQIWYAKTQPKPLDDDGIALYFDAQSSIMDALSGAWQSLVSSVKSSPVAHDGVFDEILIKLSAKQVNDAMHDFIVKNVDMLHDLHLELHDDWLRLFCTLDIQGVFASVSCDLRLVQAVINGNVQRFVFEQLSDTKIIELHSKSWWHVPAAKMALKLYKLIMRQDVLGFALSKIEVKNRPFATHKGNIIYLDIHRYLAKQTKILNMLKKVQVNDGYTKTDKLLLKLQVNFSEMLNFGQSGDNIITEDDKPNTPKTDASNDAKDHKTTHSAPLNPEADAVHYTQQNPTAADSPIYNKK